MGNPEFNIDTEQVFRTIEENLKAIREGFDPSILSPEAQERIYDELQVLIDMCLKLKAKIAKD